MAKCAASLLLDDEFCVDHLRCALSAGSILLDNWTALTESLAVILLQCLYGRDAGVAVDPKLVFFALGLFVRTPTDKDVSVILKALR